MHSSQKGIEVWWKPLDKGAWAMCALNRTARPQKLQIDWKKQAVVDDVWKREARFDTTTYTLRDLWTKQSLGTTKEILDKELPSHDVLMLRLDRK